MKQVAIELSDWLRRHGLHEDGVTVRVVLSSAAKAHAARAALRYDTTRAQREAGSSQHVQTRIHGVEFEFTEL